FPLLHQLHHEVKSSLDLKSQVTSLIALFLKYLKEPRYQSPLTISELSSLFHYFYKDLNALVIHAYTLSNSTKKQLIALSATFNQNPKTFDYLLAIANYSTSSIKLLKRSDNDALYQLRVFNYYKFLTIFETIEQAQLTLYDSTNTAEESLYDKIFRFDERDVIYQEFLEEKLDLLRRLQVPFSHFIESNQGELINFIENLPDQELHELNATFAKLKSNITPYSKMTSIVDMHKNLIKLLVKNGFKNNALNNDVLLPTLIFLIIYKLENKNDLYLNFTFIKNFINLIDPYKVELFNVNLSSYVPVDRSTKPMSNKYRQCHLFDLINLNESQSLPEELEHEVPEDFKFYDNDKDLTQYILENFLNNGEINYYLTNFEAIIMYLSDITIDELDTGEELVDVDKSNKLFHTSLLKLVEEELETHFKFPDGELEQADKTKEDTEKTRSRSSSIMNTISNKLNETRSRSNSSIMNSLKSSNISLSKENFPTLASENESIHAPAVESETISLSMMKNILGRIGSVSVLQFRGLEDGTVETINGNDDDTVTVVTPVKKNGSLINRLSPSHTRTRSSSLEATQPILAGASQNSTSSKRNSITSKFTSGVSEFMTKLNTTNYPALQPTNKNVSNSSLQSLDNGVDHDHVSVAGASKRPEFTRSRTTSLQIMDKWFNNIGVNQTRAPLATNTEELDLKELTRFQSTEVELMSIKDLRVMKNYYDQLCLEVL
ncbi:uncharacterized protein CANTADRAFT_39137, partial [Suhomyces tanzawaensis NRRL Y-17324]